VSFVVRPLRWRYTLLGSNKSSHLQPDVSELDLMRRERLILLSHLNVMKLTRSRSQQFEFTRAERIDRVTTAVFDLDRRIAEIEVGNVLVRSGRVRIEN